MNTNDQPPYDPHQYDPTVDKGYNDPTQYRPASDSSQDMSTQPKQPSTQPPYIPAQPVPSDPYSAPGNGTPVPSDPYQANAYGTPPHFTSHYIPNPYLPPPPPPPSAVSPYGKKLFLGLAGVFLFSFILVGSTPETTTTQSTPPSVGLGMSLLIGIIVCVFVVDWRGFFNLEGLLQWRQMSPNRRLGMGCLFLCFYPIFAFIYAIRAGFKAFRGQDRLFAKEWDMPQPVKRRAKIGMISGSVVALFFFIVSLFANTSASAQGSATSVTPAATHTNQSVTSTQNQKAITPTPTTKPKPTPSPTPTPKPYAHFGDGTFEVGKDIKPGTYRTREASSGCYFARLKGFGGAVDDIIANGNTDAPTVITIAPTDKGFQSTNCGTWTQDLSAITTSKTSFNDGIYIVGTDIQPGTYKSSGQSGCYFARLSGFGGTTDDIIANGNTDTATIITIAPGDQGFQSANCGTWTKE